MPFKFAFARYFLTKEQLGVLVVALDRKWKAEAQNWTPSSLEHVCMRFNRFPWFNELKCFILIGRNITNFFAKIQHNNEIRVFLLLCLFTTQNLEFYTPTDLRPTKKRLEVGFILAGFKLQIMQSSLLTSSCLKHSWLSFKHYLTNQK